MPRVGREFTIVAFCFLAMMFVGCGKKEGGQQSQSAQQARAPSGGQTTGQAAPEAKSTVAGTLSPAPEAQSPAADQAPSPEDTSKLADQNRQAPTQMNQGKVVEALPGETLKALLPADLPGMKQTDASAERTQAMGFDVSKAEGQYSNDNGEASVTITITDIGGIGDSVRTGMAAWTTAQYSRETDSGYEKTIMYKSCKGTEEYNKNDKNGTVRILVADRFIVDVEGNGVTMDAIKQALDKIDLAKLGSAASGS
jgi:hypothetical protein